MTKDKRIIEKLKKYEKDIEKLEKEKGSRYR